MLRYISMQFLILVCLPLVTPMLNVREVKFWVQISPVLVNHLLLREMVCTVQVGIHA